MKFYEQIFAALYLLFAVATRFCFSQEIQIETYEDRILIQFDDLGKLHHVYLDEQQTWSGSDPEYILEDLTSSTPYVVLVQDEDLTTKAVFYTKTLQANTTKIETQYKTMEGQDEDEIERMFSESHLNVSVFEDRIELDIGFIPNDDDALEIYRNNIKIGETSERCFADCNIEKGKEYNYDVYGKKKRSEEEFTKAKEHLTQMGVPLTDEILNSISYRQYILGKYGVLSSNHEIANEGDSQYTLEGTNAHTYPVYILRYTTFIPWPSIYVPADWNSVPKGVDGYAEGDNRCSKCADKNSPCFSPLSQNFRTQVDARVDFLALRLSSTAQFGTTRHYSDKEMKHLTCEDQAKLDQKKVRIKNGKRYGDRWWWHYEHAVSNPCVWGAPDIDWEYKVTVWKNGKWDIWIKHDHSPAHEVYIAREGSRRIGKGWAKIHTHCPRANPWEFMKGLLPEWFGGDPVTITRSGSTPKGM